MVERSKRREEISEDSMKHEQNIDNHTLHLLKLLKGLQILPHALFVMICTSSLKRSPGKINSAVEISKEITMIKTVL